MALRMIVQSSRTNLLDYPKPGEQLISSVSTNRLKILSNHRLDQRRESSSIDYLWSIFKIFKFKGHLYIYLKEFADPSLFYPGRQSTSRVRQFSN